VHSPTWLAAVALITSAACGESTPGVEPACGAGDVQRCAVTQMGCEMTAGAAACVRCGDGQHADGEGRCGAIRGTPRAHDFPMQTIAAGSELLRMCRSWTLNNDEDLWLVGVELTQDELSHHSNWTFAPDTRFPGSDGIWPCADRGYDQLSAAIAGGVIYAQSTQADHEVQVFPEGAAVRIPAHSTIFSDIHLLNVTETDVTGHASLTLYTVPREQVQIPLAPFHLTYHALALPPQQRSRVSMTCEVAAGYMNATGHPLDARLFYALPHTHGLGTRVFLNAVGGPLDGRSLLDVVGQPGEARGLAYQPPIDLAGVTGLRFGCEFDNPRAETVGWGFGDQEMCEMLGFIQSRAAFEGRASNQIGMGSEGALATFEGDCNVIWLDWSTH
jgi:hypothetical protein